MQLRNDIEEPNIGLDLGLDIGLFYFTVLAESDLQLGVTLHAQPVLPVGVQ